MSDKNRYINQILKRHNLKATPQRIILIEAIEKYGHATIEELYEEIKKILPTISLATVYKNLKVLIDNRIVKEVHLESQKTLFELNTKDHIHLICKSCNKIIDREFDRESIINFAKQFTDMEVIDYEINLYFMCKECRLR
ncbi:transcriptional repressor [Deferribacter autotrophicus]|uniref:Transcriptional repressor n=1 Tax=Deferribacter autotrophicus TaxID=500465 RepID=A0A5A8F7X0_9BACT|nr:Fur family transcriptional regulator [Deferribacter autotrophicus]KAA0259243.1 transcriptional repressor [Deferribacter autotrophicus]